MLPVRVKVVLEVMAMNIYFSVILGTSLVEEFYPTASDTVSVFYNPPEEQGRVISQRISFNVRVCIFANSLQNVQDVIQGQLLGGVKLD